MFTIITSTLNCRNDIEKTARSILEQKHVSVQWVVIDGASTDGTQEVLSRFGSLIDYFVSEPDSGIYDAWNKACTKIREDWVIFLGAGDYFASATVLSEVAEYLQKCDSDVSYVYGDVLSDSIPPRKLSSGVILDGSWDRYRPKLPYHQGVFHNAHYLISALPFDTSYRIVSDTKLLLGLQRLGQRRYIPIEISIMASGGVSQHIRSAKLLMKEFFRLEKEMGYSIPATNKAIYFLATSLKLAIYHVFGQRSLTFLSSLKIKLINLFELN